MEDLFEQINPPTPEEDSTSESEQEKPVEDNQVLAEAPIAGGGEEVIEGDAEDDAPDELKADGADEASKVETSGLDMKLAQDAPKPAEKKGDPPKIVNVVEEDPYEFDKCLISIGIGLMPDDGHPEGRPVILGVRNHQDEPIVRMCRLSDLSPLPDPIQQLLDQLKEDMPARSEKAAAKKKKAAEAAKSKSKVTVGKTVPPVKAAKAAKAEKPKPATMNLFDMFDQ